jgi:diguanylate cyclase (GGDEF)-like protein
MMGTAGVAVATAAVVAIVVGVLVHLLDRRRLARAERALHRSEQAREKLRLELETLNRLFADTAARARALGAGRADGLAADAFDPVSGLLRERFVAVLIQLRVAGARRRLHPVAVVALEADGIRGSAQPDVDDAMRALGSVIRETLREADCACRVGDVVVIAALDDTTEEGARLAIERVQAGLRTATGDVGITVSAGIACYPTHALEAPDLVARAGEALLDARSAGTSRVATANGDVRPT